MVSVDLIFSIICCFEKGFLSVSQEFEACFYKYIFRIKTSVNKTLKGQFLRNSLFIYLPPFYYLMKCLVQPKSHLYSLVLLYHFFFFPCIPLEVSTKHTLLLWSKPVSCNLISNPSKEEEQSYLTPYFISADPIFWRYTSSKVLKISNYLIGITRKKFICIPLILWRVNFSLCDLNCRIQYIHHFFIKRVFRVLV